MEVEDGGESNSSNRKRSQGECGDMEDIGQRENTRPPGSTQPVVTKHKTTPSQLQKTQSDNWHTVLGAPPDRGTTRVGVVERGERGIEWEWPGT